MLEARYFHDIYDVKEAHPHEHSFRFLVLLLRINNVEMLPRTLSKNTIDLDRTRRMKSSPVYSEGKIDEHFHDKDDMIIEGEEEYDELNDETFGAAIAGLPLGGPSELDSLPNWDEFDQHNDETFGEDVSYDWETEHEKMVSILENTDDISPGKPEVSKNGHLHRENLRNAILKSKSKIDKKEADDFGSSEITNEICNKLSKPDKWFSTDIQNDYLNSNSEPISGAYSHGYSLFPSGINLLQNAGIHIPPVSSFDSSKVQINSVENIEKMLDNMKVQNTSASIPSVADLEKQWINDAVSKSIITADCFRAYNSAFFVNSNSTTSNSNPNHMTNPVISQPKPVEHFVNSDAFRNDPNHPMSIHYQRTIFATTPSVNPPFHMNGEVDAHVFAPNRFPPFDPKSFPVPIMTESGIIMCDNQLLRNTPHFAEMNYPFVNNNLMNRPKALPALDPSVIVSSETPNRIIEPSMLIEKSLTNVNIARLGMNVFPTPPPGLTIDPAKLHHIQNTAVLQSRQQVTPILGMQPLQVLSAIDPTGYKKQLNRLQKEEAAISNIDEYAGMMTEREKYWLAGVQLLQINSMDPFKDDYYFTNYQARRKGNRNKNQTTNNNNWKKEHRDYSPLRFENSLGKVQVGSVVAPRKVIDTDIFENSPKHNGKENESVQDDPIANTSNRKRKAIMLHIENMYGKIISLESLQVDTNKEKKYQIAIKAKCERIISALREEILNLKEDFKIIMSIKKGKRLILRFLSFCDSPGDVWYQIFEILDRIIRGDHEHCILLSYLPYFRTWLYSAHLNTLNYIADYFKKNLQFYLQDKFSVSVIANMIEQAELRYVHSTPETQNDWMEFIITLAETIQVSDNIQRPVVSVKPQVLRSHLLKCKNLENCYLSYFLKIFSNNSRK